MPENRTQFAQKALDLADLFAVSIGATPVNSKVVYAVQLAVPEGASTGGGVQAVQHICLVPHGGNGTTLVAGFANQAEKTATLRTHACLVELHQRRSPGTELPLDRGPYEYLLMTMERFFVSQGLSVSTVDATGGSSAAGGAPVASAAKGKGPPWTIIALGVAAAIAVAIALLFLRR
ncbi:MAG: hypothetical protein ACYCWW_11395 [Deltaproteobacteria bacterium]